MWKSACGHGGVVDEDYFYIIGQLPGDFNLIKDGTH